MAARTPLDDPEIDRVWIDAACSCGFQVQRGDAAYASTDGNGTILVGSKETLDPDDSLCQLVLHELCHALVEGEASWRQVDWGLCNTDDRDSMAEAACLRLQAHFADRGGLRLELCPTTPWQAYYQSLPPQPLLAATGDEADISRRARAGESLALCRGMSAIIDRALATTAALLTRKDAVRLGSGHPTGFFPGPAGETCGTCAWRYLGGRGTAVERCRQSAPELGEGLRVHADLPACERWEPPVACGNCGACCREAYHSVSVSVRDPVVWKQPALVVRSGHRWSILREGDRCAALEIPGDSYRCRIYPDRPRTCREFERGGRHCLVARRRVGLSR
jgi:hypothetical protein